MLGTSDSTLRKVFQQVENAVMCAAIHDRTFAQIAGGGDDLDQLMRNCKTECGSIEPTSAGGSTSLAEVILYSASLGVDISEA